MSNQEMQFADPDWKPSQQLDSTHNPQEQEGYIPQPMNTGYREQNKWGSAVPYTQEQEGYTGVRPYAGPVPGQMQGGNFRSRPYRRHGRGPWFWIILAFIIISLASGGMRSFNGFGDGHLPFNQRTFAGNPIDYPVTGQPTIVINDPSGNVTVTTGQSSKDVIIQPANGNNFPGNPNDFLSNINQNANVITVVLQDSNSVDLQVTVPVGANLQLNTDGGDITFNGTIGTTGTYQFQTGSGDVHLNVPTTPSFLLHASTSSGSINANGFPGVKVLNNVDGQKADSVVGEGSKGDANMTITSNGGDINLNNK